MGDTTILQDQDPGSNALDHLAEFAVPGQSAIRFAHQLGTPWAAPVQASTHRPGLVQDNIRTSSLRWPGHVKPYNPLLERSIRRPSAPAPSLRRRSQRLVVFG
jgi:hypothetical protein